MNEAAKLGRMSTGGFEQVHGSLCIARKELGLGSRLHEARRVNPSRARKED